MKQEQSDDSLYEDLFVQEKGDAASTRLIRNLETLHSVSLSPTLSWAKIEEMHRKQLLSSKRSTYMAIVSEEAVKPLKRRSFRPSRRRGIAFAAILLTVVLTAAAFITSNLRDLLNSEPVTQHILQANQFVELNQSQTVGGVTVKLQAAYADSNLAVVGYSLITDKKDISVNFSATTQEGQRLSQFSGGRAYNPGKEIPEVVAFNTYDIPSPSQQLTLQIQGPVTQGTVEQAKSGHAPKVLGTVSFTISSLPFHAGKILTPHQSVTVNGQTATLERVVITPAMTNVFVSGLPLVGGGSLNVGSGEKPFTVLSSGPDDQQPGIWVLNFTENLSQLSGTWKLTFESLVLNGHKLSPGATFTFQFAVA